MHPPSFHTHYEALFISQNLRISGMTPTWILPIYPLLLAGPLAGVLVGHQPPSAASPIRIGGVLAQGLGWMVTTFCMPCGRYGCCATIFRRPLRVLVCTLHSSRPNRFVRQSPSFRLHFHAHQTGYTVQALISLGSTASKALPAHFQNSTSTSAANIIKIIGAISGIFLFVVSTSTRLLQAISTTNGFRVSLLMPFRAS